MDNIRYLPDFYIPSLGRWIEVKGTKMNLAEIKKCEEFCRRKDNDSIKYSIVIGVPLRENVSNIIDNAERRKPLL